MSVDSEDSEFKTNEDSVALSNKDGSDDIGITGATVEFRMCNNADEFEINGAAVALGNQDEFETFVDSVLFVRIAMIAASVTPELKDASDEIGNTGGTVEL